MAFQQESEAFTTTKRELENEKQRLARLEQEHAQAQEELQKQRERADAHLEELLNAQVCYSILFVAQLPPISLCRHPLPA